MRVLSARADSAFSASYDEHIENCTRMGYTAK